MDAETPQAHTVPADTTGHGGAGDDADAVARQFDALLDGILPGAGEFEWRITAGQEDGRPPVLEVVTSGGTALIELTRETTRDLLAGLRAADTWHREQLRRSTLPPASDPAARLRARFDPARVQDWWRDPANSAGRAAVIIAAVVVVVLVVLGSR